MAISKTAGKRPSLQVRVMVDGKARSRSFPLWNSAFNTPLTKAEINKLMAEAQALNDEWLHEQQKCRALAKTKAKVSERNKTTPVRGIYASVYPKSKVRTVKGSMYWRFQVGVRDEHGCFRSRSFQVKRGAEKLAWVKACTALADQNCVDPQTYIRRWPGSGKMRTVFTALEKKRA